MSYIFFPDLYGVGLVVYIFLFNALLCYLLLVQDRTRYPWGKFQWARLGIAVVCWLSSGLGVLGSFFLLLPILAWICLLIMTGFWVFNIPLERGFIKFGTFLGFSCWLLLFLVWLSSAELVGGFFTLVLVFPVTLLAVFVSRFHYYDLADFSDSPSN